MGGYKFVKNGWSINMLEVEVEVEVVVVVEAKALRVVWDFVM